MAVCPNCGKESSGKFCDKCGTPLAKTPVNNLNTSSNYKPAASSNSKMIIALVAIIVLAAGGYFAYQNFYAKEKSESVAIETVEKATYEIKDKDEPVGDTAKKEAALGPVALGDKFQDIKSLLGSERGIEKRESGVVSHMFTDINVIVSNGIVTALESNTEKFKTGKGAHQGSTLDEVLKAYGESNLKSSYGGLILYEYDIEGEGNLNKRLRFAVNPENKVEYISIREVAKSSNPQVTYQYNPADSVSAAKNTLISFHNYITDHKLRDAYNCLSSRFQSRMSYDGWAKGFATTVESSVSDIAVTNQTNDAVTLTYTLTARDNPGGTNRFRGTATLEKDGDAFKVNKKM